MIVGPSPEELELIKTELFLEGRMVHCGYCRAREGGCFPCSFTGYLVRLSPTQIVTWHAYKYSLYRIKVRDP